MNARNTFDHPDQLVPQPFAGAKVAGDQLIAVLPSKSVVVLELH